MNGLTLKEEIVGISSVSMSPTSDGKVNVEHFISEKTRKLDVVRFWVNMWYLSHLCGCS